MTKFKVGDILTWPWQTLGDKKKSEVFKVVAVERYGGCVVQYRILQWNWYEGVWCKPWADCDFFQNDSVMEKHLVKVHRLRLLLEYGVY